MKTLYAALIGIVGLLMLAPLALAGPPSWDDQINRPSRFKVLRDFLDEAVLDKETGLVWERFPLSMPNPSSWLASQDMCNTKTVGRRKGWRVPTIQELASLIDPTVGPPGPTLPPGNPFVALSLVYWSATTNAFDTGGAWVVTLFNGDVFVQGKGSTFQVWCVRGGQGVDPQ